MENDDRELDKLPGIESFLWQYESSSVINNLSNSPWRNGSQLGCFMMESDPIIIIDVI